MNNPKMNYPDPVLPSPPPPLNALNDLPLVIKQNISQRISIFDQVRLKEVASPFGDVDRWTMMCRRTLSIHVGAGFQKYFGPEPVNSLPRIELIRNNADGSESEVGVFIPDDMEYNGFNRVRFLEMDDQIVEWLVGNFREIHNLEFVLDRVDLSASDFVVELLTHWAPKLTQLTIWLGYVRCTDRACLSYQDHKMRSVFAILGTTSQMVSLRKFVYEDTTISNLQNDLDLPVLSHLSEFTFKTRDSPKILVSSLMRYARHNENLVSINIGNEIALPEAVNSLYFPSTPELSAKITYVNFNQTVFDFGDLCQFFEVLTELRTLKFKIYTISILEMVNILHPLQHLTYLSLEFPDYFKLRYFNPTLESYEQKTLPQVKVLQITVSEKYFGFDLTHLNLDSVFPNLHVFILNDYRTDKLMDELKDYQILLGSFMIDSCPDLRKIVFNQKIIFLDDFRGRGDQDDQEGQEIQMDDDDDDYIEGIISN